MTLSSPLSGEEQLASLNRSVEPDFEVMIVIVSFLGRDPPIIRHENKHNLKYNRTALKDLPPHILQEVAPYRVQASWNPQRLNLLQYMTPMAHLVPGMPSRCV